MRRGSCLLFSEPYERYDRFLGIMANPICCGRSFSLPTFDLSSLSHENPAFRDVWFLATEQLGPITCMLAISQGFEFVRTDPGS